MNGKQCRLTNKKLKNLSLIGQSEYDIKYKCFIIISAYLTLKYEIAASARLKKSLKIICESPIFKISMKLVSRTYLVYKEYYSPKIFIRYGVFASILEDPKNEHNSWLE